MCAPLGVPTALTHRSLQMFYPGEPRPVFFVANRGHHADVGGISPGSMPAHSHSILEEGATFLSFKLVQGGVFQQEGGWRERVATHAPLAGQRIRVSRMGVCGPFGVLEGLFGSAKFSNIGQAKQNLHFFIFFLCWLFDKVKGTQPCVPSEKG